MVRQKRADENMKRADKYMKAGGRFAAFFVYFVYF